MRDDGEVRFFGWFEPPTYRSADDRIRPCASGVLVMIGGFLLTTNEHIPLIGQILSAAVLIPIGLALTAWAFVPNRVTCRVCNATPDTGKVHLMRVAEQRSDTNRVLLECPACGSLYERRVPSGPTTPISARAAWRRYGHAT